MDTIRYTVNRKRKQLVLLILCAFLCFAAGVVMAKAISWLFSILALAAVVCAYIFILVLYFDVRCPRCNGNIGYTVAWPPTWNMSVSNKIKYCPFCGVSLDAKINIDDVE